MEEALYSLAVLVQEDMMQKIKMQLLGPLDVKPYRLDPFQSGRQ